ISVTRLFNFFFPLELYPNYHELTATGLYFLGLVVYFLTILFTISETNQLKAFFVPKSPYLVKGFIQKEHEIKMLIDKKIVSQKMFKNKEVTAKSAASALGIKENELKEFLRLNYQQNFNEFINDLRVNEFKKMSETIDLLRFDISGIADEVGFTSRSTFYRYFNEKTGITPGQYIKLLKKDQP
ncbi:MAG: helix-turn-helix domain-containing protein, partial [Bacteroidota bacterium]